VQDSENRLTSLYRRFDNIAAALDSYSNVSETMTEGGRVLKEQASLLLHEARRAAGRSERSPFIEMTQGRVIDVKFAEPLAYELDGGERGSCKRLQATVVPSALTFCAPEE
jgi:hypothetical protein